MRSSWLPFMLAALSAARLPAAESPPLVEVRSGTTVITGKVLARGRDQAILLDRSGGLHDVKLNSARLKTLSGSFLPLPAFELRNQLQKELGKEFECGSTRHFVVLAPSGRAAAYADVLEDQYATMQRYFKTRDFVLSDPPFPLVAIVFSSRQAFVEYAQKDGAKGMSNMLGYYSPRTNRVALYEQRGKSVAARDSAGLSQSLLLSLDASTESATDNRSNDSAPLARIPHLREVITTGRVTRTRRASEAMLFSEPRLRVGLVSAGAQIGLAARRPTAAGSALGSLHGDLKATLIHEATHQIAYNIGLHSRLGETPRWVVEGMATVFEPEGVRDRSAGWNIQQRLNRERFLSFQNYAKSRRTPKSLASFIEGDSLFQSATADFYAQSWALSFFLIETRPRNYSAYLKRIAARDPFADYPASERLSDFKHAFQADFDWLDIQFLRFVDGLK